MSVVITPRLVFLDSPRSCAPGRVRLIFESDGECAAEAVYENKNWFWPNQNNRMVLVSSEGSFDWADSVCLSPHVIADDLCPEPLPKNWIIEYKAIQFEPGFCFGDSDEEQNEDGESLLDRLNEGEPELLSRARITIGECTGGGADHVESLEHAHNPDLFHVRSVSHIDVSYVAPLEGDEGSWNFSVYLRVETWQHGAGPCTNPDFCYYSCTYTKDGVLTSELEQGVKLDLMPESVDKSFDLSDACGGVYCVQMTGDPPDSITIYPVA